MVDAARQSGASGFALASSVKAVGEMSNGAWNSATVPKPVDSYGASKPEAETMPRERGGAMRISILRCPLVYGPRMRGDMLRLFQLIDKGWPIPVGDTKNARGLLVVGNSAAAIRRVLEVTRATDLGTPNVPVFLAAGIPISTAARLRDVAHVLGASGRTFSAPIRTRGRLFGSGRPAAGGCATGLGAIVNRLAGSLEADEREFGDVFAFTAPFTREDGFAETVRWFRSR